MKALLDGDIIAYRCAAVTEQEDSGLANWQADELVQRILSETEAEDHLIYISGENNFRYQIYPAYKANRKDKPKPRHLETIREHLLTNWNTIITDGYEADDALGIDQRRTGSIICSIDKDLRQIPGSHYNFVNRERVEVSDLDGWRNFYLQLLIGDTSDNIPGCPGIGKAKAPRLLEYCETPRQMYEACLAAYIRQGSSAHDMDINAQLLYIWRKPDDQWKPPLEKQQQPQAIQ